MLVDSHSHIFSEEFKQDLPEVIERAKTAGVTHIILPNIDSTTIGDLRETCDSYPGYCYPLAGLHPTSVNENYKKELLQVKEELESSTPYIGIGEIGMDLYWDKTYLKEQQETLRQQLEWAVLYDLPVVLHCRAAHREMLDILKDFKDTRLRGIFHSFTGTEYELNEILTYEKFLIGINGIITFKKSTLPDVIKKAPLSKIVLETDAPYLAPVPHRGKRNESSFIVNTLSKVAEIYNLSEEIVANVTAENALRLFRITKNDE